MNRNINILRHITENFELYGFGNEQNAVLQCTKELIENSFDACKDAREVGREVRVVFQENEISSKYLNIEVTDNGCGMGDPEEMLCCFRSTKSESNVPGSPAFGKYGAGLSVSLLYSQTNTEIPLRYSIPKFLLK